MHRALTLAPKRISGMEPEGDRDAFIIVASDGVWEFISSQASLARVSHQLPQASRSLSRLAPEAELPQPVRGEETMRRPGGGRLLLPYSHLRAPPPASHCRLPPPTASHTSTHRAGCVRVGR